MIPTIKQLCKAYSFFAAAERMKTGRPGEVTVDNALAGMVTLRRALNLTGDEPISVFSRKTLDRALVVFMDRGISRVSALTYIQQLQSLLAKWTRPYYQDAGWEIPQIELPTFRAVPPRYQRPSPELLARVKAWYLSLTPDPHSNLIPLFHFAATMMLEFAMRNGDVLRLTRDNFVTVDPPDDEPQSPPRHFLSYTPHKTALTSGRRVFWPIHDDIWTKIKPLVVGQALKSDNGVLPKSSNRTILPFDPFPALNRQLRTLGFRGNKASYELRKICIDHVYQRFGVEMASSISGDDLKTLTHYYADPAQPNIGNVRIVDLL